MAFYTKTWCVVWCLSCLTREECQVVHQQCATLSFCSIAIHFLCDVFRRSSLDYTPCCPKCLLGPLFISSFPSSHHYWCSFCYFRFFSWNGPWKFFMESFHDDHIINCSLFYKPMQLLDKLLFTGTGYMYWSYIWNYGFLKSSHNWNLCMADAHSELKYGFLMSSHIDFKLFCTFLCNRNMWCIMYQ